MAAVLTGGDEATADPLSEIGNQIVGRSKDEVRQLFGPPVTITYWTNTKTLPDTSVATRAAQAAETLDEIWVYRRGRVHFSVLGTAIRVDDRADRDLPPDEPGTGPSIV
jgi:chemotaxis protein CheY-P-specific phosphatase CheC